MLIPNKGSGRLLSSTYNEKVFKSYWSVTVQQFQHNPCYAPSPAAVPSQQPHRVWELGRGRVECKAGNSLQRTDSSSPQGESSEHSLLSQSTQGEWAGVLYINTWHYFKWEHCEIKAIPSQGHKGAEGPNSDNLEKMTNKHEKNGLWLSHSTFLTFWITSWAFIGSPGPPEITSPS